MGGLSLIAKFLMIFLYMKIKAENKEKQRSERRRDPLYRVLRWFFKRQRRVSVYIIPLWKDVTTAIDINKLQSPFCLID